MLSFELLMEHVSLCSLLSEDELQMRRGLRFHYERRLRSIRDFLNLLMNSWTRKKCPNRKLAAYSAVAEGNEVQKHLKMAADSMLVMEFLLRFMLRS